MKSTDLTATDIVKTVNVLTVIRWIKLAWEMVTSKTIVNCFKHWGVKEIIELEGVGDPFADPKGVGDPFAGPKRVGAPFADPENLHQTCPIIPIRLFMFTD